MLLISPTTSQALSFAEDTIFLTADNRSDCEAQGGGFIEWYGEKYCTKAPEVASFTDVSSSHRHAVAIGYVQTKGIVGGYPDGSFKPDAPITRVELVKIMSESSDIRTECLVDAARNITDVDTNAWYYGYLSSAMCARMVGGYPDNTFKPANPVLITEAAKIISNGFGHNVTATSGAWYEGFINNLAAKRAIPTNIAGVGSELTRGQMAEIIYRLKNNKTNLASHTLTSLTAEPAVNSANEAIDTELDTLFEDIFDEDGLDLDGLPRFLAVSHPRVGGDLRKRTAGDSQILGNEEKSGIV